MESTHQEVVAEMESKHQYPPPPIEFDAEMEVSLFFLPHIRILPLTADHYCTSHSLDLGPVPQVLQGDTSMIVIPACEPPPCKVHLWIQYRPRVM